MNYLMDTGVPLSLGAGISCFFKHLVLGVIHNQMAVVTKICGISRVRYEQKDSIICFFMPPDFLCSVSVCMYLCVWPIKRALTETVVSIRPVNELSILNVDLLELDSMQLSLITQKSTQ